MKICGAVTALVTPFTKNGGIHYDKLTELIEFQIANGADGIVLLGTTGEEQDELFEKYWSPMVQSFDSVGCGNRLSDFIRDYLIFTRRNSF